MTLRLTVDDRALLDKLVALRAAELAEEGVEVTAASLVRGLIRREAKARGLGEPTEAKAIAHGAKSASPKVVREALKRAIEAGESQRRIAARSGVDAAQISRFLAGRAGLHEETLQRLAAALL